MKRFLLFISLFNVIFCSAQNYQCLQNVVKHYFTNDKNYLRCSFDFEVAYSDSTVFYSFSSLRGPIYYISGIGYPINSGGSWLGDTIIMRPDGTFLFFNIWSDTVIIKSQANIGDSWMFYNDSSIYSYTATVLSIDTMTVLDTLDSVKTIQIKAYASGILNPGDTLNNFRIKISKRFGFVEIFDLYTFPYRFTSYIDYFYSGAGSRKTNQIFRLFKYHTPTQLEIFDFNPGDVFERKTTSGVAWMYPCVGKDYESLFIDSVKTKTILDSNHIRYTIHHTGYQLADVVYTAYDRMDTITVSSALVYYNDIPEYNGDYMYYYYYPLDTSWCFNSSIHIIKGPSMCGTGPSSPCTGLQIYKEGYGEIKKVSYVDGGMLCDEMVISIMYEDLIFAVKNGDSCGTFIPYIPIDSSASTANILLSGYKIHLSPNPTTSTLTISSTSKISQINIANLLGQTLLTHNYNSEQAEVDVADLPSGVYLVRINGNEVRKFVKE